MILKNFLSRCCALLFLCSLLTHVSFAQFQLLEDFQQGIPMSWTVIDNDQLTPDSQVVYVSDAWVTIAEPGNAANQIAVSTSKYDPAGTADDWLISPSVSLLSNSVLTWQARALSPVGPPGDGYEVRISTTTPTLAGFLANAPLFSIVAEDTGWVKRSVDLAAAGYTSGTVYFAFRNNSTDKFLLAVDDIAVFDCSVATADAGVIDASTTVACSGSDALKLGLSPAYLAPSPGNVIAGNSNDVQDWSPLPGRPFDDGDCCWFPDGNTPYQLVAFQVTVTGSYDIEQTQFGFDGLILLYTDPLDLTALPPTTFLAGNDDGDSVGVSEILNIQLTQGETYYLITTGYEETDFGFYVTTVSGPGDVLLQQLSNGAFPYDYNYVVTNSAGTIVSLGDDLSNPSVFSGSATGDTFSVCGIAYVEDKLDLTAYLNQPYATLASAVAASDCAALTSACHQVVISSGVTGASAGVGDTICAGRDVTLTASGGTDYLWSTGDSIAVITVTPSSTTTYTVTVSNDIGCSSTASVEVYVYASDAGSFYPANAFFACEGEPSLNLSLSMDYSKNFYLSPTKTFFGNTSKFFTWAPLPGRPFDDGTCCSGFNPQYNVQPFRVDTEGLYAIHQEQNGYDGLILLYTEPFDFTLNPPVTFIAGNDDSAFVAGNISYIDTVFLEPYVTYYLISTGFTAGDFGDYFTTLLGPGNLYLPDAPDSVLFEYEFLKVINGNIESFGSDFSDSTLYPGSPTGTDYELCAVSYLKDSIDISLYLGTPFNSLSGVTCLDATQTCRTIRIFTEPVVFAGVDDTICFGENFTFNGSPVVFGDGEWSVLTGNASIVNFSSPNATAILLTPGLNQFIWTVDNGGCSASDTVDIYVTPPSADAGANDTICIGETGTLTASGGVSYAWNTGALTATINVTPVVSTNYIVTVTDANGCSSSDTARVVVNPLPVVNVPDASICPGGITILDAGNPGATFLWSSGETTQTISVDSAGTFTVTVVDANGCENDDDATVTVGGSLTVVLNDLSLCEGDSLNLNAGNPGAIYSWSTGDTTQVITVNTGGVYSVTVSDATNCTGTDSATITELQLPFVSAGNDTTICAGESLTLTAVGNGTFLWNTGDISASIFVSPSADSTFSVTVTGGNNCSASDEVIITVSPLPVVDLGADTVLCSGASLSLSAEEATIVSYNWSTGDNSATISVSPSADTLIWVEVINLGGCISQDSIFITVIPSPVADAGTGDTICGGESVTLTTTGGVTYLWSTGNANASITVNPSSTQTYSVTVTAGNGCTDVADVEVVVHPLPNVNLGGNRDLCEGFSLTLSASGAVDYLWSTGETTASISVSPTSNTTYSVTATSVEGCSASDNVLVSVRQKPVANAGSNQTICSGESVTLTATGGTSYQWSSGSTMSTMTVAPNSTTTYAVTVSTAFGCDDTAQVIITVNDAPSVTLFGIDTSFYCLGATPLPLAGAPTDGVFAGAGVSNSQFNPGAAGVGTHTISYSLTDPVSGCTGIDSAVVTIDVCIGVLAQALIKWKIYPNPTNNFIFIETELENEAIIVRLFDNLGRILITETMNNRTHQMNLGSLAAGSYRLQLNHSKGITSRLIIKNQ